MAFRDPNNPGSPPSASTPSSARTQVPVRRGSGTDHDLIADAIQQADDSAVAWNPTPDPGAFSGYEILREIHRGGQGVVYQAIQIATRRKVAIKVMHRTAVAEGSSAGRTRFDREVQVLGQLNHPNIVRIHDSGETTEGDFFFVMDYVSGRPLDDLITRARTESIQETLDTFMKICDAVNAAHLRGVIHRDLKPANIRVDNSGEPVVMDFGLAKLTVPDFEDGSQARLMTMTGQFVGSLPWASPEQAEGQPEKIDVRTDVYSLGVILYQLLTGRFPYDVIGNMRDVLDNILRTEPALPSTIRRQVNDEVETIVLKCLSKERDRRYQTAGELARDIRRYLNGEPIEAKRDSGWYIISKTLRRYRTPVSVAAGFLVLLAGSSVAFAWLWKDASAARGEALAGQATAEQARQDAERARDKEADFANAIFDYSGFVSDEFLEVVDDLVGATAARKLWLERTTDLIEAVEVHVGEDPKWMRRLGDLYEAVGTVHGGLFRPRSGTTDAADGYLKRALAVRSEVADQLPEQPESHVDVGRSTHALAGYRRRAQRFAEAEGLYDEAIEAFERAAALLDRDAEEERRAIRDLRIESVVRRADCTRRRAEVTRGFDDASPVFDAASRGYEQAADYWNGRADDAESVRGALIARAKLASLKIARGVSLTRDAQNEQDQATARQIYRRANGEFISARQDLEQIMAEFSVLLEQDPVPAGTRRDWFVLHHDLGLTHMRHADVLERTNDDPAEIAAHRGEALRIYERAVELTQQLVDSDLADIEARRDLAISLNKLGNEQRDRGDLTLARLTFQRSLDLRLEILATDRVELHQLDVAIASAKLGGVLRNLADRAEGPEKAAGYAAASAQYRRAAEELAALGEAGVADARPELISRFEADAEACEALANGP